MTTKTYDTVAYAAEVQKRQAFVDHIAALLERPGLTPELAEEIQQTLSEAQEWLNSIEPSFNGPEPATVSPKSWDGTIAQLQQLAASIHRETKAYVARRDEADRKAAFLASVPNTDSRPYSGIGAESLLVDAYLWRWGQADVDGRQFQLLDLEPVMRSRKSYSGYPPVEWRHGHAGDDRRHGDVVAVGVDAYGLRAQMRVNPPRTPAEAARVQVGGGVSMTLEDAPGGGYALDSVSLTDRPRHPSARIVSVRPYR